MKTFRDFLKEDVMPTAQVADGSLDINKPAVRAAINAAIAGVTSQPAVTPYVVYNRLSKLLAQYHIILPKKFLEGDKGVEVFELRQFGHKMGMTDSGEFVNEVPSTHYLFLQYGILTPYGITYAKPIVGGMFKVMARVVDKEELDKLLDIAEITMSEEAECRQMSAKANAPKEPMHDITSDEKKKGNKEAVATSEKDLNEVSLGKLVRYRRGAEQEVGDIKHFKKNPGQYPAATSDDKKRAERSEKTREAGIKLADKKMKGKAKVNASMPKTPYMEEEKGPCWKGYEMVGMKKKAGKPVPNCVPVKEEKGDRLMPGFGNRKDFDTVAKEIGTGKGGMTIVDKAPKGGESSSQTIYPMSPKSTSRVAPDDVEKKLDTSTRGNPQAERNRDLQEKAPPGAKYERMVKHIKDKFSKNGLTAKEKSIAYATAWKAKNREKGE